MNTFFLLCFAGWALMMLSRQVISEVGALGTRWVAMLVSCFGLGGLIGQLLGLSFSGQMTVALCASVAIPAMLSLGRRKVSLTVGASR